jgi:hypothetical protein
MTIAEKFYAMNAAIKAFLVAQGETAGVYKYGTVITGKPYPYFQSDYKVYDAQPFGTDESGTYTDFYFYLNFFTAASNERKNDAALFNVFEKVREAIGNPNKLILQPIASVTRVEQTPEFNFRGGLEVLQRGLILTCRAVCSHVVADGVVDATIDNAVQVAGGDLNFT